MIEVGGGAAMLVAGVASCAKKAVKPAPPVEEAPVTTTTQGTETMGKYTRESLDTDSCLRQRVVYFDLDQTVIKPEFQAQIACHAAYLRQFPVDTIKIDRSFVADITHDMSDLARRLNIRDYGDRP